MFQIAYAKDAKTGKYLEAAVDGTLFNGEDKDDRKVIAHLKKY